MKITLRKASVLQNSINDLLKGIKFTTAVDINEFQDVEALLLRSTNELNADISRYTALTEALYEIRKAVGQANAASVNDKLASVAFLDKRIKMLSDLTDRPLRTELTVINGKLDKIKARPADARQNVYGYNDEVSTSIVTQLDLDGWRKELATAKKAKQKLQDEILELNVRTDIELSDAVEETLQRENLL